MYLRIGNILAPDCFEVENTFLIAAFPRLDKNKGCYGNDEGFTRAKLRLEHEGIAEMFQEFNKASHRFAFPSLSLCVVCQGMKH